MHKQYKQNVYIIVVSMLIPVGAQNIQDLQRAKADYEKFQQMESQQKTLENQIEKIDLQTGLPEKAEITPYFISPSLKLEKDLKHYGYDFFTKRDTVAFWENLPTPSTYLLGSGDELIISLWGETQLRQTYTISREGNIYDPSVGLLNLSGKTIPDAMVYLKDQFSRIYSTLKGRNPSTFMDVSLGKLRLINVNFVGQVKYPGVYPVHPFSTIITGLIQAGGIDTTGTLRRVQIKRAGKIFSTIDLYDYFLNGELPKKIQLRDQDIVVIPVKKSTITIDSAVVNPGIYEGVSGETVFDLIQYAGGLTSKSSSTVSLQRITPINERNGSNVYKSLYLEFENTKMIGAQDGDHISVHNLFNEQEFIQLIGQVKVPGSYNYYQGMQLIDLLKLGGGLEDTTYIKSIYMKKAEIIRRNPHSRYEEIININLEDVVNPNNNTGIILQNLDRVVIHANLNFFERKNVKILGEVNIPGSYPLLNNNESLKAIINRAGGLSSKALENGISIYREKIYFEDPPKDKVLTRLQAQTTVGQIQTETEVEEKNSKIKLAWEGFEVTLMPGDSVIIKEKVGAVFVTGEVYNAGLVEFQKGKSIRYYLDSAGGINNYGNRNNVILVYPNGITVPWRRFRSPKIMDGSTIVVYQKEDLTPFDATLFANNMASLLSSLITILVLSKQLSG